MATRNGYHPQDTKRISQGHFNSHRFSLPSLVNGRDDQLSPVDPRNGFTYNNNNFVLDTLKLYHEYTELVNGRNNAVLDGSTLTVATITAISRNRDVVVHMDPAQRTQVEECVAFLRKCVNEGRTIYGVTTGFGGSADHRTNETAALQEGLITMLNVAAGEALPEPVSRGSVAVRVNSNIKGYSALRWEIMDTLVNLLNNGISPVLPLRGSITASGDLVPLSYVAALVTGRPYAYAWIKDRQVTCKKALEEAGEEEHKLQAKEGLAIVNGTSVAAALSSLVVFDMHFLLLISHITTAMTVEVLKGAPESFSEETHLLKPHPGQMETAANIAWLLQGSGLITTDWDESVHEKSLRQDRYSLRTAPQWLGPHLTYLKTAAEMISIEINSVTDNPIVDPASCRIFHGGNFQGAAIGSSMDQLRLSVQSIAKLSFCQLTKLANKYYNNRLTPNLSGGNPHLDYGIKGIDIAMASYMSELQFLANPVTNCVNSAENDNQDVNSLGLISARYTEKAVSILTLMYANHLYALAQAVDLRSIEYMMMLKLRRSLRKILTKHTVTMNVCTANSKVVTDELTAELGQMSLLTMMYDQDARKTAFGNLASVATGKYAIQITPSAFTVFEKTFDSFLLDDLLADALHQSPRLLGNTRRMYDFIRNDLKVPFSTGKTDPGTQIEKIHEAIKNDNMKKVLFNIFKNFRA